VSAKKPDIPDDQQRPLITDNIQRCRNGTIRPLGK